MVWDPERSETPVVRGFREFVLRSGAEAVQESRWSTNRPERRAGIAGIARSPRLRSRGAVLCVEDIDLADLALALEDHSEDHGWVDGPTRRLGGSPCPSRLSAPRERSAATRGGRTAAAGRRLRRHGGLRRPRARPPRARDLLDRAIVGRGAFRRFKDTLFWTSPSCWLRVVRLPRRSRRAAGDRVAASSTTWTEPRAEADAAVASLRPIRTSPTRSRGSSTGHGLARRATRDLRRLYRHRLRGVVLVGAWARGDAHPESPVELLVVLDDYGRPLDREASRRADRVAPLGAQRHGRHHRAGAGRRRSRCWRAPRWTRACARSRAGRPTVADGGDGPAVARRLELARRELETAVGAGARPRGPRPRSPTPTAPRCWPPRRRSWLRASRRSRRRGSSRRSASDDRRRRRRWHPSTPARCAASTRTAPPPTTRSPTSRRRRPPTPSPPPTAIVEACDRWLAARPAPVAGA